MNRHIAEYISFVLYLIVLIRLIASQAVCFKRSSGGLEKICCDNYVKRHGVCVECKTGSKSTNEEPCIPCKQGRYGRKCNSLCKCKINERCDRVSGCVLGNIFSTSNFLYGGRNNLSTIKHTPEITNGYLQHTITVINDISTTRFTKEHFTKTEIIVYSVGSSSIILIIAVFCFVFFWFYNKKRKYSEKGRIFIQDNHERTANEEDGSLYDSINENEIYDDNIQIIYSEESTIALSRQTSDSEGSSQKSGCSGYLHPYTTVTNDLETHSYCTQIKSYDSSSSSSVVDDLKRDSGYTHPYQQLDVEKSVGEKNEYSKLVQYLELTDIAKPVSMSKSLSNKTILSSLKVNDQKEYDVGVLCPVFNSPCNFNKNDIPNCQSFDLRFHPVRYFSSFPTFDRRENTGVENEKLSNLKHMSV